MSCQQTVWDAMALSLMGMEMLMRSFWVPKHGSFTPSCQAHGHTWVGGDNEVFGQEQAVQSLLVRKAVHEA